jgi:hypothetical protein
LTVLKKIPKPQKKSQVSNSKNKIKKVEWKGRRVN